MSENHIPLPSENDIVSLLRCVISASCTPFLPLFLLNLHLFLSVWLYFFLTFKFSPNDTSYIPPPGGRDVLSYTCIHRWPRLLKRQTSITVYRLLTKEKKLPFSLSNGKLKPRRLFFICLLLLIVKTEVFRFSVCLKRNKRKLYIYRRIKRTFPSMHILYRTVQNTLKKGYRR